MTGTPDGVKSDDGYITQNISQENAIAAVQPVSLPHHPEGTVWGGPEQAVHEFEDAAEGDSEQCELEGSVDNEVVFADIEEQYQLSMATESVQPESYSVPGRAGTAWGEKELSSDQADAVVGRSGEEQVDDPGEDEEQVDDPGEDEEDASLDDTLEETERPLASSLIEEMQCNSTELQRYAFLVKTFVCFRMFCCLHTK